MWTKCQELEPGDHVLVVFASSSVVNVSRSGVHIITEVNGLTISLLRKAIEEWNFLDLGRYSQDQVDHLSIKPH